MRYYLLDSLCIEYFKSQVVETGMGQRGKTTGNFHENYVGFEIIIFIILDAFYIS